jgi:aspartate carbamoyltransferase catalytic subunit
MTATSPTIIIRLAGRDDSNALRTLATLDSRLPLTGPAMLAEVDGTVRAALDLSDGSVAADPFVRTAEVVEMLRLRARRLQGEQPATSLRERVALRLRRPRGGALSART